MGIFKYSHTYNFMSTSQRVEFCKSRAATASFCDASNAVEFVMKVL